MSQLLTLYTTPVIYLYFDRLQKALHQGKKPAPDERDIVSKPPDET